MNRCLIIGAVIIALLACNNGIAQRRGGSGYHYRPSHSSYSSGTYKSNGTTYRQGAYYKHSGLPKVERSASAKREFLHSRGLKKIPKGMEIDHVVPLSKGGADLPSNMQLLPKDVHKHKTSMERKRR